MGLVVMAHGYTKLFESITDSTIWASPDTTRLVWITMLAMSDQHGYIGASVPGLAARARVSLEACITALDSFQSPDKWSRTPDHEGRRIATADGGWVLLNHAKYRAERSADDRKEYMKLYMQNKRALANVSNVNLSKPQLANTKAKADTKAKEGKSKTCAAFALPDWINETHWILWVASRKKMNPEQKQMQVDKLKKWKDDGLDFAGALENAAANGTQGLFLPNGSKPAQGRKTPAPDNFAAKDYGTGVNPL